MHSLEPLDKFFASFACCASCHDAEAAMEAGHATDVAEKACLVLPVENVQIAVHGSRPLKS
jgi:hypothetical protein